MKPKNTILCLYLVSVDLLLSNLDMYIYGSLLTDYLLFTKLWKAYNIYDALGRRLTELGHVLLCSFYAKLKILPQNRW